MNVVENNPLRYLLLASLKSKTVVRCCQFDKSVANPSLTFYSLTKFAGLGLKRKQLPCLGCDHVTQDGVTNGREQFQAKQRRRASQNLTEICA